MNKLIILVFGGLGGYALALSDYMIATFCIISAGIFFNTELFFGED